MLYKFLLPFIYALTFAIIELVFYRIKYGYYHTTLEQFILSFVFSPFMIQINRTYNNNVLFVLLYPILFWLFEIVGGNTLLYFFDTNNAWTYESPYNAFNNMIRLDYYFYFMFLGIIFNYIDFLIENYI